MDVANLVLSSIGWVGFGILGLIIIRVAIAFLPARVARRTGHRRLLFVTLSRCFSPAALISATWSAHGTARPLVEHD